MANNDTTAPSASGAPAPAGSRRKTSTRRKSAVRKKPAASAAKRPSPRAARDEGALASLLDGLSRQASRTGTRIAALSERGVSGARRTLRKASAGSKKTIDRLAREWKGMDTARRAQFIAALLGTLAAASAPIVRSRLKKK